MNHVFTLSVLLLWLVRGSSTAAVVNFDDESNDCPEEFTLECGTNAHCQRGEDEFRLPECVCNNGTNGDPYQECVKDEAAEDVSQSRKKRDTSDFESTSIGKTTTTTTTEISDDLCFPNPCQNGGTCQKLGDFFACICPTPFCGWYCEKVDGDQSDECERWAKLGYCENAFKEFMLSNCPRACREWKQFKSSQRAMTDEEASASGEGENNPEDMDDDDIS